MHSQRKNHNWRLLQACCVALLSLGLFACSSSKPKESSEEPVLMQEADIGGITIRWDPAAQDLLARALSSGKMKRVSVRSKWNVLARVYSIPVPGHCIEKRKPIQKSPPKVKKKFSSSARYGSEKNSQLPKPDICGNHLVFTIGSKYDPDQFDAYDLGEFGELKSARSYYDKNKDEAFVILTVARYPRRVASKNKRLMQETKQFSIQVFPDASARLVGEKLTHRREPQN